MRGRRETRSLAAVAFCLSLCTRSLAESDHLIVERAAGAEACPDATELSLRVQHIRERVGLGKATYRIVFSRSDTGLTVSITAEPSGRARTLTSGDANCEAIAKAAAVTLALLFDAEPAETPASPAAPPPEPVRPPSRPPAAPSRSVEATLAVSGGALAGVTGPVVFAGTVEAGLVVSRIRASLGAVWAPPVTSTLAPGEVRVGLVGGTVRACFAPIMGPPRIDLCSGALFGFATAVASGYSRNETRERPWLSIPIELAGSLFTQRFGAEAGVAALVPIARSDFAIDGLGVPYQSSAVGVLASLRVIVILPL
jgi:hypothetical protein